ncbi:family 78 glycoside hydrolase catalytic domain [Microbacterium sp. 1P10UB]|uniref:alpha-L-rhamnosidase n=1 Tax=unclassified Microbacterium TaxID=2609290 RepID=UPI0039A33AEB
MTRVTTVRAEYRSDSAWVGVPRPRLSWVAATEDADWTQGAVEITLGDGRTAVIETARNSLLPWPFDDLEPRADVTVSVRLRDANGAWSRPSEPLRVRNGSLGEDEWRAGFVRLRDPSEAAQPFVAASVIEIDRQVASATLYWTALGAVVARIDGHEVDDAVLAPGWTAYPRVIHETTDVTAHLTPGSHTLSLEVTGAWYTEQYGFGDGAARFYGDQPSAAAQLHIRYVDGDEQVLVTDGRWRAAAAGVVVASGIYAGESVDARRALDWGPQMAAQWDPVLLADEQPVPAARTSEPVRRTQTLPVVEVLESPSGRLVLDFGQNLVGRLRLRAAGAAGSAIVVRHAEVLESGELALRPLRRAAATDTFITSGEGEDFFEPVGTFHGFRYVDIEGWPGDFDPSAVEAVVLHSDMRRTGRFMTSHALIQQLHENVVWGMKGNFLALPTDCPQRDERLGWTGDVQVFAPTATTLYDCNGFLAHWLTDLRLEQDRSDGVVPTIVPNVFGPAWPAAGWGDAATVVPSVLAERYADLDLLHRSVPSMQRWVAVEGEAAGGLLWDSSLQFGDWLDPSAPADMAGAAKTPPEIVATAYRIRSLDLLSAAAKSAGEDEASDTASREADATRHAFQSAYVTAGGRMMSDAATAYALALRFDIVRDAQLRAALAERLAHVVRREAFHISTGFLGTPVVLDALVDFGHVEEASRLMLQTRLPSWLYPVTMGATTVWERWDSLLPDGTVNPGEMTSFNHYALGAVVDWLYRRVAGVAPAADGYRRIRFAPLEVTGMDDAKVELDTSSGVIAGGWRRDGDCVVWTLDVPAHARAEVSIPGVEAAEVGPGHHSWITSARTVVSTGHVMLWSPIADIVAHPGAYAVVMGVLEAHDRDLADNVRRRTDWTMGTPLGAALFGVPADVVEAIAAALNG